MTANPANETSPKRGVPELSRRDLFAAFALSGLAPRVEWTAKQRVAMAYELADAIMERSQEEGEK